MHISHVKRNLVFSYRSHETIHFADYHEGITKVYSIQECIPVGCVPTAAVAASRCQYHGGCADPSLEADPLLSWTTPFGGRPLSEADPTVDRQTLLKTLPSLAVGNKKKNKNLLFVELRL